MHVHHEIQNSREKRFYVQYGMTVLPLSRTARKRNRYSFFVTNDRNFRKQTKLAALRRLGSNSEILAPAEAVTFICEVTGTSIEETEKL